jgi:formylmethanofuran dehydrogenase subunit E
MGYIMITNVPTHEELFDVKEVRVTIRPEDMPGRPSKRVMCESCREQVQDGREQCRDGRILCRSCADKGYYEHFF